MANSSSCHKCGAKLVPGAEICDLCGTLVSSDGASVPDWIDVVDKAVPAYRTIPDPIRSRETKNTRPEQEFGSAAPAPGSAPRDSGSALSVEPEEDFFDQPTEDRTPDAKPVRAPLDAPVDLDPVEVAAEEDFFSSDPAGSEIADGGKLASTEAPSKTDFTTTEVVEEEDFFSADSTSHSSKHSSKADSAATEAGPTEMEIAKSVGSFQQADFVEAEDFFGGGVEDLNSGESPTDDEISEMAKARLDGSTEPADVVEAEDFFSDAATTEQAASDAPVEDVKSKRDGSTSGATSSPGRSEQRETIDERDARPDRGKKGGSRKQKKRRKRQNGPPVDEDRVAAVPPVSETRKRVPDPEPPKTVELDVALAQTDPVETKPRNRQVEHESVLDTTSKSVGPGSTVERGYVHVDSSRIPSSLPRQRQPKRSSSSTTTTAPAQNRNAIVVTAAAVLLIGGLFMINALSKQGPEIQDGPRPQMTAVNPIAPPPLTEELESNANQLKNQIATLSGARRISKQRELISMYSQERRFDLAAVVQQEIAESLNSEIEWVRSGNYYYDWMETQAGATKTDYAKLAIASYQRALDINPDNLDVRTNMALAYLYDPSNPMQAIRNTNLVLEKDPDHLLANFNRGVMLMQINRLDQAVEQFERVQTLVGDANSPVYQRAENAIQTIRQHRTQ